MRQIKMKGQLHELRAKNIDKAALRIKTRIKANTIWMSNNFISNGYLTYSKESEMTRRTKIKKCKNKRMKRNPKEKMGPHSRNWNQSKIIRKRKL